MKTPLLSPAKIIVTFSLLGAIAAARADWLPTSGSHLFSDPANWTAGAIDGQFQKTATGDLIIGFDQDTTLTPNASNYYLNITGGGGSSYLFQSSSTEKRTLTLGPNGTIATNGSGVERTVVLGSTSQPLELSLGTGLYSFLAYKETDTIEINAKITGSDTKGSIANGSSTQAGTIIYTNDTSDHRKTVAVNSGTVKFTSIANSGSSSALGAGSSLTISSTFMETALVYTGKSAASTNRTISLTSRSTSATLDYAVIGTESGAGPLTLSGLINVSVNGSTYHYQDYNQAIAFRPDGGEIVVSGVISNQTDSTNGSTLSLGKLGSGRLLLSGTQNTYKGKTSIRSGVLAFASIGNVNGGASSLGNPDSVANGTIDIGSSAETATLSYVGSSNASSDRVVNLAGTTGGAILESAGSGSLVFTGDVTATGAGKKMLTLAGSNAGDNALLGAISDSAGGETSLHKTGGGTWILGGDNQYTGTTTVEEGLLLVNGSLHAGSAVQVVAGTLGGSGTIHGDVTVASGAVLQAGDGGAEGSLTVGGSLALDSGTLLAFTLGADGESHSSLILAGGFTFETDQTILLLGAEIQSGLYEKLITGLTADPGSLAGWKIANEEFTGFFSYNDGAISLELASIPEPHAVALLIGAAGLLSIGAGCGSRRRRETC